MEPLSPQSMNRRLTVGCPLRHVAQVVLLPLLVLATGCITLDSVTSLMEGTPTGGPVCQVVATWHNEVVFTPDPARNGMPAPGLAGRVYLFGPEINYPLVGDGSLTVDLYYDEPTATGQAPILLEEWRIDKDTLRRLARKDAVGWGYTLFLPWGTYRPEIRHVHLRIRYEPPKGIPLYQEGAPMTLSETEPATSATAGRPGKPRG
jgi:hypothetical protein